VTQGRKRRLISRGALDSRHLVAQWEGQARSAVHAHRDWSDRYPLSAKPRLGSAKPSFVIDGKRLSWAPTGSPIEGLHSGKRNAQVRLYAFGLLADVDVGAMGFPNLHVERGPGRLD
jgi:hypothetical protein